MPYIYSKYRIVWSKDRNSKQYTLELTARGTDKELCPKCPSTTRRAFRSNIRLREGGMSTRYIWERELHLGPDEPLPRFDGLPDKLDRVPIRMQPKKRYAPRKAEPWTGDAEALRRDVEKLTHLNADRRAHGQKPLSYGYWRAGIR